MTREERLDWLCRLRSGLVWFDVPPKERLMFQDALSEEIKALSAEPCEDCISRQAARKIILDEFEGWPTDEEVAQLKRLTKQIDDLPSVTPKQKMGRWIMPVQDDGMSDPIYYQVRCSECGFDLDPQTWHMELHQYGADKYCPNCGAKMQEVDE